MKNETVSFSERYNMSREIFRPNHYFIIFHEDKLILRHDYAVFSGQDDISLEKSLQRHHLIGEMGGNAVYCAEWINEQLLPSFLTALPIKKALEHLPPNWYSMITRAITILQWDKNHQFCGACGNRTERVANLFEKRCPVCQLIFYPRISPSVIVLIEKGDYILMARGAHFVPGAFGLIAGFVEPGESLEEAVHREVKEEVGITIKALRYVSSQSWPFPDSLVAGFRAQYDSGELTIDYKELEVAGWYRYDALPGKPSSSISIASRLIDGFVAEKKCMKGK